MASPSLLSLFFIFSLLLGMAHAHYLSPNFYARSCPRALPTIRTAVNKAVAKEKRMGASLLRLHFHDCFGCDASILLDDTATFTGEKTAGPNNNSVRGYEVIDTIKSQVESLCPGVVSCADIVAVAARDSVVALGGPTWTVRLGRRDSTTASFSAARTDLPGPNLNLSQLISAFSKKGLTTKEMVVLSGTHTIGKARCTSFRNHIYNDTDIDPAFAASKQKICPRSGGDDNLSPLDGTTTVFDNVYFRGLKEKKGLLHSDQELYNGGSTDSIVETYSINTATFFRDVANAMVKMGNISPLTGTNGQIRTNCRKIQCIGPTPIEIRNPTNLTKSLSIIGTIPLQASSSKKIHQIKKIIFSKTIYPNKNLEIQIYNIININTKRGSGLHHLQLQSTQSNKTANPLLTLPHFATIFSLYIKHDNDTTIKNPNYKRRFHNELNGPKNHIWL
ncbi:unnamed protein product, partial [Vitis vinifera]